MTAFERLCYYRKIFQLTVDLYRETRETASSASCAVFWERVGKNNGVERVGRVAPSSSDFVADMELAAKKVLSEEDYSLFLSGKPISENLEAKVSRELTRRGIWPFKGYLQAKDVA